MKEQIIKYYYGTNRYTSNVEFILDNNSNAQIYKMSNPKKLSKIMICGVLENNELSFGVSVCSKHDVFVKKIGRDISKNRALNHPIAKITLSDSDDLSENFLKVCRNIEMLVLNMKKLNLNG